MNNTEVQEVQQDYLVNLPTHIQRKIWRYVYKDTIQSIIDYRLIIPPELLGISNRCELGCDDRVFWYCKYGCQMAFCEKCYKRPNSVDCLCININKNKIEIN